MKTADAMEGSRAPRSHSPPPLLLCALLYAPQWMIRSWFMLCTPIVQRQLYFNGGFVLALNRGIWSVLSATFSWLRGDDCVASGLAAELSPSACSLIGTRALLDGAFNDRWGSNAEIEAEGSGLFAFFGSVAAKGERTFSLSSFGRAGELLFGLSAWGGLFIALVMSKQCTGPGPHSGTDLHETTTVPKIASLLGLELVEEQAGAPAAAHSFEGNASSVNEEEIPLTAAGASV